MKLCNLGPLAAICLICFAGRTFSAPAIDAGAEGRSDYFGAKLPGDNAELFARGIVSLPQRFEARIAFSADLRECYLTETDATFSHPKLLLARRKAEGWTAFEAPSFAGKFKVCHEPFLSADDKKLYFTADGDPPSSSNMRDIWMVDRLATGWGEPVRLPSPINSENAEFFFSQSHDGLMVFASNRAGGAGDFDLYYIEKSAEGSLRAVNFGEPLNTPGPEYDPCISADGRFIIFASARHGGPHLDLYVSYRQKERNGVRAAWSAPVPLGGGVNTPANEYGASLSPDGKYLFFVRHDGKQSDIYWMSTAHFVSATSKATGE